MWYRSICGLLVAVLVAAAAQAGPLSDLGTFKQDYKNRTVFIQVRDQKGGDVIAQGTGTLLESGFVLSSLHLVADITDPDLGSSLGSKYTTGIVGKNEGQEYQLHLEGQEQGHDIALFRFSPDVSEDFDYACVASRSPQDGHAIGLLGFPGGLSLNVRQGIVSGHEAGKLVTDLNVTHGDSGSGVFDEDGNLAGIVQGGLKVAGQTTTLSLVIPINYARNLLDVVEPEDNSRCTPTGAAPADTHLTVSYMRLTGAMAVPIFIQAQSWGGVELMPGEHLARLGPNPEPGAQNVVARTDPELVEDLDPQSGLIDQSIADFWVKSEFRDARPLATELWRKLASDGWSGARLAASADRSAADLYCVLSKVAGYLVEPDEEMLLRWQINKEARKYIYIPTATIMDIWPEQQPDYVYAKIDYPASCANNIVDKVGFLFLILKNESSETYSDVTINSLTFQQGTFDPAIWRVAETAGLEHLTASAGVPALQPYLATIDDGQTRKRYATDLRPGESFIWLLSVYRTDTDLFEKRYLDVLEVPTAITAKVDGQERTEQIRLPRRNAALPLVMPHGWYHQ